MVLEVWIKPDASHKYALFRTYPICAYSGHLGNKTKQGDSQSVEGFYVVTPRRLNSFSEYRLSFNEGYPNPLERALGYTGGDVMIHGGCGSVGCLALNDDIDELYTLMDEAMQRGVATVPLHAFPFRMTTENMQRAVQFFPQHLQFWLNIAPA